MLADTASWSWVWRPGSMLAGSMCPNDRVRGSRTSTSSGSASPTGGTKKVSSPKRARARGAERVGQAHRHQPVVARAEPHRPLGGVHDQASFEQEQALLEGMDVGV